jgi:hypothetical protein
LVLLRLTSYHRDKKVVGIFVRFRAPLHKIRGQKEKLWDNQKCFII